MTDFLLMDTKEPFWARMTLQSWSGLYKFATTFNVFWRQLFCVNNTTNLELRNEKWLKTKLHILCLYDHSISFFFFTPLPLNYSAKCFTGATRSVNALLNFFSLAQNSTSCTLLLEWLFHPHNGKCNYAFIQRMSNPAPGLSIKHTTTI